MLGLRSRLLANALVKTLSEGKLHAISAYAKWVRQSSCLEDEARVGISDQQAE